MKKAAWISLSVVAALVIGVGVWWLFGAVSQKGATNEPAKTPTVERTDLTSAEKPTVAIRDLAFDSANIKVKKGTVVTWTNNDGVGHSVVADDSSQAGGLPTDAQMFGKNETFQVTFKQTGTFRYHCVPHAFMHGSVEVVD